MRLIRLFLVFWCFSAHAQQSYVFNGFAPELIYASGLTIQQHLVKTSEHMLLWTVSCVNSSGKPIRVKLTYRINYPYQDDVSGEYTITDSGALQIPLSTAHTIDHTIQLGLEVVEFTSTTNNFSMYMHNIHFITAYKPIRYPMLRRHYGCVLIAWPHHVQPIFSTITGYQQQFIDYPKLVTGFDHVNHQLTPRPSIIPLDFTHLYYENHPPHK